MSGADDNGCDDTGHDHDDNPDDNTDNYISNNMQGALGSTNVLPRAGMEEKSIPRVLSDHHLDC